MKNVTSYCILILLTLPIIVNAQIKGFNSHVITMEDGMAKNAVYSVIQDKKGFIWLGLRNGGLDRFDGITFEHHRHNPNDPNTIAGNWVYCLYEDTKGNIWAGTTNNGLSKYNPSQKVFTNYVPDSKDSNSLCGINVYDVIEDEFGQIWVGTNSGLCVYNPEKSSFFNILDSQNQSISKVNNLCVLDGNHILAATEKNGICLIDVKQKKLVKQILKDKQHVFTVVYKDREERLWFATKKSGVYRSMDINHDKPVPITNAKGQTTLKNHITDIIQDTNGNIWLATNTGVCVIPSTEVNQPSPKFQRFYESKNDKYSLSQNITKCVYEDSDGKIWIGTPSGGVNYITLDKPNFVHVQHIIDSKYGLDHPQVISIYKQENKLFVATRGGGINIYNKGRYSKYISPEYLNPDKKSGLSRVGCLARINDSVVVAGANNGFYFFNHKKNTFVKKFEGHNIRAALKGDSSNLWLQSNKGLYVLDAKFLEGNLNAIKDQDFKKVGRSGMVLFKDINNAIWSGTYVGLDFYNDTTGMSGRYVNKKGDPSSLSYDIVTCITSDLNNKLWVGTSNGLNLLKDSTGFTSFTEWDGLPDNEIHNVFADKRGYIWITTTKGLTSFKYNEASNKITDIRTYKNEDGLQGNVFSKNCALLSDQEVYIGGKNGFNSFKPAEIKTNLRKPQIVIKDFKLFNKEVEIATEKSPLKLDIEYLDEIELTHKQSVFTLEYAALNFIAAEKCQYAYIMEGLDEHWNEVGNKREATYTNLPHGKYIFRVKASNNDGIWNEEGTSLIINILPPWWKTWLFRITLFLVIAASIYFIVRRRTIQVKERQRELEEKVREATAESQSKNARLEEAKEKLSTIMEGVKKELGQTSEELLHATNSQASSIEEISSSIDQMTQEINESASGASKMFQNVKLVEDNSEKSVAIVGEAVTAIDDINKSIKHIQEFAKTTNLLSLNASIEAAKAGVHGKSFGVVANEVKKLAESSQEVAITIKKLSDTGLQLSKDANERITVLQNYIKDIVSVISQISQSAQSQSHEAVNVNTAIQQISNYISGTANLAEKLDEAIKSLSISN